MNKTCFLLLIISFMMSQNNRLHLVHADNSFYDNKNKIDRLTGNVKFVKDTLSLAGNKVVRYRDLGLFKLFGNVVITSGKYQKIFAESGNYNKFSNVVKLYQKVKIFDKTTKTFGDTVFYNKSTDITEIFGNAKVNDLDSKTEITGKYIHSNKKKRIHVYGNAQLNQPNDSLKVSSDTLIINKLIDKSFAHGNVKIYQNNVYSEGNFTEFNHHDSTMAIVGNAHITFEKNDITGDSIFIVFKNKSVSKIDVIGDALALSFSEEHQKNNKFEGKEIFMVFENKKLETIRVLKNAISVFYLEGKAGVNSITADSIKVFFKDNKVDHINEYGGTQGTFYPSGYSGKIKNDD